MNETAATPSEYELTIESIEINGVDVEWDEFVIHQMFDDTMPNTEAKE